MNVYDAFAALNTGEFVYIATDDEMYEVTDVFINPEWTYVWVETNDVGLMAFCFGTSDAEVPLYSGVLA